MKKPLPAGARRYQEALRTGDNAAIIAMRKAAERTRARKKAEREAAESLGPLAKPVAEVVTPSVPEVEPPVKPVTDELMSLYDEGVRQRDSEAEVRKRVDAGEIELNRKTGEIIPLFEEPED